MWIDAWEKEPETDQIVIGWISATAWVGRFVCKENGDGFREYWYVHPGTENEIDFEMECCPDLWTVEPVK